MKVTQYSWHKISIQNCTKYCTIEQSCAKQQIVSQKLILYSAHALVNTGETLLFIFFSVVRTCMGSCLRAAAPYKCGHSLI